MRRITRACPSETEAQARQRKGGPSWSPLLTGRRMLGRLGVVSTDPLGRVGVYARYTPLAAIGGALSLASAGGSSTWRAVELVAPSVALEVSSTHSRGGDRRRPLLFQCKRVEHLTCRDRPRPSLCQSRPIVPLAGRV